MVIDCPTDFALDLLLLGSRISFFSSNSALDFEREATCGMDSGSTCFTADRLMLFVGTGISSMSKDFALVFDRETTCGMDYGSTCFIADRLLLLGTGISSVSMLEATACGMDYGSTCFTADWLLLFVGTGIYS